VHVVFALKAHISFVSSPISSYGRMWRWNPGQPEAAVADLLKNLNLTAEEKEVAAFQR
jgi:hypothetical protein